MMRSRLFILAGLALAVGACTAETDQGTDTPADDESALWNAAAEENGSGKDDSAGCSGVIVPDKNGFNKHIALTFDDGPNLTTTPIVLAALKKHGAKGTFMVNGGKLGTQAKRDLLKQMSDDGHFIGNHSQNHLNLKTQSASTVESEVALTQNLLVGLGIQQRYFRFPFGSASCESAQIVRSHGYAVTGWHIDSADWCYASGKGGIGHCDASVFKYVDSQYRDNMVGYIVSQAQQLGGGVMLMHDIHSYSANMLDEVLTALEQAGFSFVAINDTSVFPKLNGAQPAPSVFIGTACKDNATCNFTASGTPGTCFKFDNAGATAGFCTIPCEGFCPDQSGAAPTFCTSLDNGVSGTCVSKAVALNHECADIPGTAATVADRFIGSSTATASTATVCVPK
jgi:peptidoglycan/xylan/chitin deacetylase (PgdA/CDA1 family)